MRILVSLFGLQVGGSQINAIEIAGELARHGHEPIIYAPDGPLRGLIAKLGLTHVQPGPARDRHPPTAAGARALTELVRRRGIDLVHAYEWSPTLEAAYGPYLRLGVPLLSTVYSVIIARGVPSRVPMIVGFEGDAEVARRRGWRPVHVVAPPIDTDANAPVAQSGPARGRLGLAADELAVVLVSRLAHDLKREGILAAVRAAGIVSPDLRLRLVIVGDGPCRDEIEAAAAQTNGLLARAAVTLAGEMLDPRDAYAAADIVLGMGTSAMKGMAFGKPVIVQGERGFWEVSTAGNLPSFLRHNFYGIGDGTDGAPALAQLITQLAADRHAWPELADYGRQTTVALFSNDAAGRKVATVCEQVAAARPSIGRRLRNLVVPTAFVARHRAVELARRMR